MEESIRKLIRDAYAGNVPDIVRFLIERNNLKDNPDCQKVAKDGTPCAGSMSLVNRAGTSERISWRCKSCRTYLSVRHDSFYSQFRSVLSNLILFIYHWAIESTIESTSSLLDVSPSTIVSFNQALRVVLLKDLKRDKIVLGGDDRIVEIDESLFVRVSVLKEKSCCQGDF